ncbi:MAG: mechanosensitive ion channel family protein [Chitinophagales bacterium]|nr:mechanosensitive ion channel family protein [Chitinophagales bacterium]MDW8419014.1 mechanosensitive ion channel family protein [Chitinophagales bacterium]
MMLLQISTDLVGKYTEKAIDMAISYAPRIVGAILLYLVGMFIIGQLVKFISALLSRKNYDASLNTFLTSLVKVLLTILLLLSIASMVGIDITSFAALLAGVGLAIGAALNGSLGNLAGGVMIMIFKPFKVGDFIEAQGVTGTVKDIGIFATTILTPENKTVIIPNGPLSTGIISNNTAHGNLRVDITMAIALDQDIDRARNIALEVIKKHPKVLASPAPEVSVLKVADGMCTLAIRPYCPQPDYWDVFFYVQENVKIAWDKNGVAGPIPARVIIQK